MSRKKRLRNLVRLAKRAAKASALAGYHQNRWRDAFQAEYGHDEIADALVQVIDYSTGDTDLITEELIEQNSLRER